jgi:hypothetical protein
LCELADIAAEAVPKDADSARITDQGDATNDTYLSRYGLLLEEMSAAGKPPSSLHGRIHGVFRKK